MTGFCDREWCWSACRNRIEISQVRPLLENVLEGRQQNFATRAFYAAHHGTDSSDECCIGGSSIGDRLQVVGKR